MQARVVLQHDACMATTDPKYQHLLKPVTRGGIFSQKVEWVWPFGTIVEDQKAIELVIFGLAEPIDKECADACGMTAEQLSVCQQNQEMAQKGIHSKEDQDLFRAGVIAGYEGDGKGGLKPIPGPNMAAYEEALKIAKQKDIEE